MVKIHALLALSVFLLGKCVVGFCAHVPDYFEAKRDF
jgi:hypothetical protein